MDYNPESEPALADQDEDMEQQTLSSSTGQSQIEVLLDVAEPVIRQPCKRISPKRRLISWGDSVMFAVGRARDVRQLLEISWFV